MISTELSCLLTSAGWFPGRRIPEDQLFSWLAQASEQFHCHVFPEAVRILKEYGGLALTSTYRPDPLIVDPLASGVHEDPELWFMWEWDLEEAVFPIGQLVSNHFHFAVSSSGRVYAKGLGEFECGASFEEALGNWFLPGGQVRERTELVDKLKDPDYETEMMWVYNGVCNARK